MRSFTLAFLSTLLLSPVSVLATYGEHGHHPDHPHQSNEVDHAVSNTKGQSSMRVAIIAVAVDYPKSDVDHICYREENTCLEGHEEHECHKKGKLCERKNKCHEKKDKCYKEYDCHKKSKICRKKTTNRYGFRCGHKFYNQAKILAAAKAGCRKIGKNSQRSAFPAVHTAFTFEKHGPYVEWPINKNGRFHNKLSKSKRRIVMTMDCAVVGAVVRHNNGHYSKCKYERQ